MDLFPFGSAVGSHCLVGLSAEDQFLECVDIAECAGVGGELGKHLAVSLKTDNTPALSHSSLKMKPCS